MRLRGRKRLLCGILEPRHGLVGRRLRLLRLIGRLLPSLGAGLLGCLPGLGRFLLLRLLRRRLLGPLGGRGRGLGVVDPRERLLAHGLEHLLALLFERGLSLERLLGRPLGLAGRLPGRRHLRVGEGMIRRAGHGDLPHRAVGELSLRVAGVEPPGHGPAGGETEGVAPNHLPQVTAQVGRPVSEHDAGERCAGPEVLGIGAALEADLVESPVVEGLGHQVHVDRRLKHDTVLRFVYHERRRPVHRGHDLNGRAGQARVTLSTAKLERCQPWAGHGHAREPAASVFAGGGHFAHGRVHRCVHHLAAAGQPPRPVEHHPTAVDTEGHASRGPARERAGISGKRRFQPRPVVRGRQRPGDEPLRAALGKCGRVAPDQLEPLPRGIEFHRQSPRRVGRIDFCLHEERF